MSKVIPSVVGQPLLRALQPLWIAALGIQVILGGALLLPGVIRLMGRGGATETVEWATYMAALVVFPPAVWVVGWVVPRIAGPAVASTLERLLVILVVLEFAAYAVLRANPSTIAAAIAGALATTALIVVRDRPRAVQSVSVALGVACGTAAWMAGGALVYWQNALDWLTASPLTGAALASSVLIVGFALRSWVGEESRAGGAIRVVDLVPIAFLVAFSFRTYPVVEHYHWGFFVGPIEQLRQGGTLLWDTPSQYGFLSILIPALLPGSAWQSFWFFQAVVYAIVAFLMYVSIRRLLPGIGGALTAILITLTTLFFRPRSETLLLPAQMTPAAGPFRFIWCFVMLAFLMSSHLRPDRARRFVLTGTAIWIAAVMWSAETAIYVTAMWFPALLVHTLQAARRDTLTVSGTILAAARNAAYQLAAVVIAGLALFAAYRLAGAPGPDLLGHVEYVLLYSRSGFGALPIDPTGTIWYLIISFLIVSTVLGLHARINPLDPRLAVWAAAWGLIWAVASYFTGRSHPVNLVAIIPVLIYALASCMRLHPFTGSPHARYVLAASMVPLLAMPVTITAGHESFLSEITRRQLTPARFHEQVPAIDPELESLLIAAGARPHDAFVLASDGRLMLESWSTGEMTTRSWLPKPFEIIGSLPEARRATYLDRNARSFAQPGWLIQSKVLAAHGGDHMLRFVDSTRTERRRFESDRWIVRQLDSTGVP
ncbi:MAG: hypothetical protein ACSLFK_10875 [Gemmatimonadaceae bacterium]